MSSQSQLQNQDTTPLGPKTKFQAHLMIQRAGKYLESTEYNRRKASNILFALADLLLAEFMLESNLADLGFAGCQE